MRRLWTVIAGALALIALILVIVVASGGNDDGGTVTGTVPAEPPAAQAPSQGSSSAIDLSRFPPSFVQCLEDQGIDLESATDISAAIHGPGGARCFDELHGG